MALLRSAAASAQSGSGAVIVIEGPAGSGKTRLVDELLAADDTGSDVPVFRGRVSELAAGRPFGLVLDALGIGRDDDLYRLAHQSTVVGDAPVASKPEYFGSTIDAFVDAVESACRSTPIVVCADDLHWADDGSLAVLGALVARAAELPLFVVLAARPTPRSAGLRP